MTRSKVKVKVTRPLKLEILRFSKCISSAIFNVNWQMTTDSETTEQYLTFVRSRFLIYVLVFMSRDFELGTAWHWQLFTYWERFPILATFRQIQEVRWRRLRTDVTTNLERSQISEVDIVKRTCIAPFVKLQLKALRYGSHRVIPANYTIPAFTLRTFARWRHLNGRHLIQLATHLSTPEGWKAELA